MLPRIGVEVKDGIVTLAGHVNTYAGKMGRGAVRRKRGSRREGRSP